ncbi:MAG: hypothetical protein WD065_09770 [Planctomycetaceae bacterium]
MTGITSMSAKHLEMLKRLAILAHRLDQADVQLICHFSSNDLLRISAAAAFDPKGRIDNTQCVQIHHRQLKLKYPSKNIQLAEST